MGGGDGGAFYVRDYSELTSAAATQPWWSLTFDLVIKLGLVIGLIYLTMWALRTYVLNPRSRVTRFPGHLDVIDSAVLGPGRQLYVVQVAGRVLVLGATSGSLATLAEITDPGQLAALKDRPSEPEPVSVFAEQLRELTESAPGFLQDKIGEIRGLANTFRRSPQ